MLLRHVNSQLADNELNVDRHRQEYSIARVTPKVLPAPKILWASLALTTLKTFVFGFGSSGLFVS
jgi:hypothetical protein